MTLAGGSVGVAAASALGMAAGVSPAASGRNPEATGRPAKICQSLCRKTTVRGRRGLAQRVGHRFEHSIQYAT
jgi:hypothetical protein